MSGPNTIGVRGPMPGSDSDHSGTCPCDRCHPIGDPEECVLEDLASRRKADLPVSADDFGPPRPSVHVEELPF